MGNLRDTSGMVHDAVDSMLRQLERYPMGRPQGQLIGLSAAGVVWLQEVVEIPHGDISGTPRGIISGRKSCVAVVAGCLIT